MKILIATPLYPPQAGGPATDSAMLEAGLPSQGIEVVVVPFGSVRHLPKGVRHFAYALALSRRMRGVKAVVAMDTFSVCLPAALMCWFARRPLVVRVPGDFAWEQAVQRFGVKDDIETFQKKRYNWRIELLRSLQRWAMGRAAFVVVPSDFFKGIVLQWGLEPSRVVRIYLGIDFNETAVPPEQVPEGKILFSLGRLVPWKGFGMLLKLLPSLPLEWHLVLAGDGPLRRGLQTQARALGVERRVHFLGTLPRAQALGWYRRAECFALNTSFESFSFQLLEAMSAGVPVVATEAGSIPELLRNGAEGILCAPNDAEAFRKAILSTQEEPYAWKERTLAAQAHAREFSKEKTVKAFAEALKELCA